MGLNYLCFKLVAIFVNNATTINGLNNVDSVGLIFLITCITHIYDSRLGNPLNRHVRTVDNKDYE